MMHLIGFFVPHAHALAHAVMQAAPELPPIPVVEPDIPTWLSAAFATGGIFQIIKVSARKLGFELNGQTAIWGSFITSIVVVLMQIQVGALTVLPVEVAGVFPWLYAVLTEALKATVAANGTYKYVYEKTLKALSE